MVVELDVKDAGMNAWHSSVKTFLVSLQQSSFWIWLAIAFLAIVGALTKRIGDPWVKNKLKYVLDNFRKKAYASLDNARAQDHRVTLFMHKQYVWNRIGSYKNGCRPWDGWLIPTMRSGHKTLDTKAIFHAPEGDNAQGIAGVAWDSEQQISVCDLPNLVSASSDAQTKKYAKRTFCSIEMVDRYRKANKPLPRSIGAIPVFVNDEIAGVLVLDSHATNGVNDQVLDQFSLTVDIIGQLLERA